MQKETISRHWIRQLQAVVMQAGGHFAIIKEKLLRQLMSANNMNPADLVKYHDLLLAMMAYPENKTLLALSRSAMESVKREVTSIFDESDHRTQYILTGTGIKGSLIIGSFSYPVTAWLAQHFPEDIEIESSKADAESIRLFFRQILPRTEYETISAGELTLLNRIKKLKSNGSGSSLNWLLHHLGVSGLPERTKESIFHGLQIFLRWKLDHPIYNRSSLSAPGRKIFYAKGLTAPAAISKIFRKKIAAPVLLSPQQKKHLVNTARAALVFYYRETEPFTYADSDTITCFEPGRGFRIVLYGMKAEKRLSIESYIGYLVLKNGIPMAYGGGWMFGNRCQFGINIFPPFRGGDSSFILGNLLNIYQGHFGARYFVIKPYQFGKNNPEALKSGAFWFYYKNGFRPENEELKKLAEKEAAKKTKDKNYRASADTLKKFLASNIVLRLSEDAFPFFDAAKISTRITEFINKEYDGNRALAKKECLLKTSSALNIKNLAGWKNSELKVLQEWSLLAQACLAIPLWKKYEKKNWVQLIKLKAGPDERSFILLLQKQYRFWKDLTMALC
ncbi:MAG: hypothetical protein HOP10_04080 [Chitinophagaceae bacterium]|nr:hypothetical protein [Chitinophagaceae bacterium]